MGVIGGFNDWCRDSGLIFDPYDGQLSGGYAVFLGQLYKLAVLAVDLGARYRRSGDGCGF